MVVCGSVVHAEKFTSRKSGKEFTKLFVPVGYDVIPVIVNGDKTALAGVMNVSFRLGVVDGSIKLFYDGEED